MKVILPQEVIAIYKKFQHQGFKIYLVGGGVRNMLLEKEVKDWDFTTNAKPEEILKLFPEGFYDNQFGTVGIPLEGKSVKGKGESKESQSLHPSPFTLRPTVIEITTFRTERDYKDFRHPEKVEWGKTIEEDLERRDFTMNAMALTLEIRNNSSQNTNYELLATTLIDPYHGREDLHNKLIKAVGDPKKRFKEDALRLMRAVRFAAQLSFTIEDLTWKAMLEDAKLLPLISAERIHDELMKILASDYPYEGIIMLKNAGLLQYILPELLEGEGVSQVRPGRHHVADVFTHNVMSLKFTPSKDPVVRFATLIHDIAKPRVKSEDQEGLVIFYNHEVEGARMAYEIANRLRFSKKERQKIVTLIRWHMFTVDDAITDAAVRRFIRRIGVDNVKDMIDVRIGDRLGSGIPESRAESWRLKKFKERIEKELQPAPFSINDLAIDGNDIMKELKIKPGREVGKLLQQLFEEVDEDLSKNTKEYLLKRIKQLAA